MTKVEIIHGFTYKIEFVSNLSALSLLSRKIEVGCERLCKILLFAKAILAHHDQKSNLDCNKQKYIKKSPNE